VTPKPPRVRLPAEWEPQSGVQLTWPHAGTDWAPLLDAVTPCFAAIAREIARRERCLVVAVMRRRYAVSLLDSIRSS
jgi:agmatine/peptidylarginine deiminase